MSLIKTHAIVLRTTPYSETSVVLSCLTKSHGVTTFMVNGVRSKNAKVKPSLLQPLTLLEIEAYFQQYKNMQRIKELKASPQLHTLHFDIVKSSIAIFIAEILNKVIKDENQTDDNLFDFIHSCIQLLDLTDDKPTVFPLYFIVQLSKYLGIMPKGNYTSTNNGFDMLDAAFEPYDDKNPKQLSPEISEFLSELLITNAASALKLKLAYTSRMDLLDFMIQYYAYHLQSNFDLKSYLVLNEVLAE